MSRPDTRSFVGLAGIRGDAFKANDGDSQSDAPAKQARASQKGAHAGTMIIVPGLVRQASDRDRASPVTSRM